jgi:hypothetical protein
MKEKSTKKVTKLIFSFQMVCFIEIQVLSYTCKTIQSVDLNKWHNKHIIWHYINQFISINDRIPLEYHISLVRVYNTLDPPYPEKQKVFLNFSPSRSTFSTCLPAFFASRVSLHFYSFSSLFWFFDVFSSFSRFEKRSPFRNKLIFIFFFVNLWKIWYFFVWESGEQNCFEQLCHNLTYQSSITWCNPIFFVIAFGQKQVFLFLHFVIIFCFPIA